VPNKSQFSPYIQSLLVGDAWGGVYPPKPNPPPLVVDGRTVALRIFRRYLSELEFFRPGSAADPATGTPAGPPVAFHVCEPNILIGWPDSEQEAQFPGIALTGGTAQYLAIGLGNYIDEDTVDKYQRGTAVQWQSEYSENLTLEIWAATLPELRAILSGTETALTPTEVMYGIRFRMPEYFGQLVTFSLMSRENIDDADAARGRRRARLVVEMRFNVVALVNVLTLHQTLKTDVDVDEDTSIPIDI
jgi:hypothetical protein